MDILRELQVICMHVRDLFMVVQMGGTIYASSKLPQSLFDDVRVWVSFENKTMEILRQFQAIRMHVRDLVTEIQMGATIYASSKLSQCLFDDVRVWIS